MLEVYKTRTTINLTVRNSKPFMKFAPVCEITKKVREKDLCRLSRHKIIK